MIYKKTFKSYSLFFVILLLLVGCNTKNKEQTISEKLWYKQPSAHWKEALPLGNGRLGAMVHGYPDEERIQMNEESLWAGCPENPYPENARKHFEKFQQLNLERKFKEAMDYAMEHLAVRPTSFRSYQPLGDLFLQFGHQDVQDYKRCLDLETGITTVEYEIKEKRFKREAFISGEYDALFFRFTSRDNQPADCRIRFHREKDVEVKAIDNHILHVDGQIHDDPDGYDDNPGGSGKGGYHMKFDAHIAVKSNEGKIEIRDSLLIISGAKDFTVILTGATDYNLDSMNFDRSVNPEKRSKELLTRAINADYNQVKKQHLEQHASVYNRVELKLTDLKEDTIPTDQRLKNLRIGQQDNYLNQLLFQYGRYLLMDGSGGQAVLPVNLQGIWNEEMWAP